MREKAQSAHSNLADECHEDGRAVLALPPRAFVDLYSAHMTSIGASRSLAAPTEPETCRESIVNLLKIVVNLARSYDARSGARYAANVMLFIPRVSTDPAAQAGRSFSNFAADEVRRFLPDFYDLDEVDGVRGCRRNSQSLMVRAKSLIQR